MSIDELFDVRPVTQLSNASVTMSQLKLSRKIGCGCSAKLAPLGNGAVLDLDLTDEPVDDWPDPLILAGQFGSIELAQGGRLIRALTGIDISPDIAKDDARWTWLQAAVVGRLIDTPFSATNCLMHSDLPPSADSFILRVSIRSEKHALITHARAGASAWLNFLAGSSWMRKRRPPSEFHHLPCPTTVQIARHTLPAYMLRTLAAGDIILPDGINFSIKGRGVLQWGSLSAEVRYLAPGSLKIIAMEVKMELEQEQQAEMDRMEPQEADMETIAPNSGGTAAAPEEQSDPAQLDMVPVTLDFELGQVRMRMGEMRTLGVGVIVPLTNGSPASIAIVSGGCTLGRGEVVDVNGRLGIRITHWGSSQA